MIMIIIQIYDDDDNNKNDLKDSNYYINKILKFTLL